MFTLRSIANLFCTVILCLLPGACNTPEALARKAAQGDPIAQYRCAMLIIHDSAATPQDKQQAIEWLHQSTAAGNRNAPAILALCYTLGNATPQDLQEARRYLTIASDRDNHRAQLLLGHFYANGISTAPAPAKAVEQIRYAAMQGSPQAAELMFLCFYDGFGVRQNKDLALGWLENAADFGSTDAKHLLNIIKRPEKSPDFEENVNLLRKKLDFFPQNR